MTTAETISGVVEARNERGIKVQGEWRNLSKFKPLELPAVGATVELGLDPKGFINTLEVIQSAPISGPESNSVQFGPAIRDRQIARLAVLKAAASFGASRESLPHASQMDRTCRLVPGFGLEISVPGMQHLTHSGQFPEIQHLTGRHLCELCGHRCSRPKRWPDMTRRPCEASALLPHAVAAERHWQCGSSLAGPT